MKIVSVICCFIAILTGCDQEVDISKLNIQFMALHQDNGVSLLDPKIDYALNVDTGKLTNAKSPQSAVYGEKFFAIANLNSNNITLLDPTNPQTPMEVVVPHATKPYEIAYGKKVFAIANLHSNNVTLLNPQNPQNPTEVKFARAKSPQSITFGHKFFAVSCGYNGYITFINPDDPKNPIEINVRKRIEAKSPNQVAFGDVFFAFTDDKILILVKEDNLEDVIQIKLPGDTSRSVVFGNGIFAVSNYHDNHVTYVNPKDRSTVTLNIAGGSSIGYGNGFFAFADEIKAVVTFVNAKTKKPIIMNLSKLIGAQLIGTPTFGNDLFAIPTINKIIFVNPLKIKKFTQIRVKKSIKIVAK
ncbi:hypothetical protein [Candidatus Uabimicrobium sp. HlEnr_7]|uniref:hypothetical protein n=1 Tax=Candidatus Uabimicrobium helgolandensis TaxID=3095367 RepID=UPI003556A623